MLRSTASVGTPIALSVDERCSVMAHAEHLVQPRDADGEQVANVHVPELVGAARVGVAVEKAGVFEVKRNRRRVPPRAVTPRGEHADDRHRGTGEDQRICAGVWCVRFFEPFGRRRDGGERQRERERGVRERHGAT